MTGGDAAPVDPIDRGLARLFEESPVPGDLAAHVLRRIEEDRWRRESRFDRVFYGWLYAAGAAMIAAFGIILTAVARALS
jgi:hypothetical protein